MANDKTYDRHINIWINGKEVKNDIASIKKEMFQLINAQSRMTIGSKEYVAAGEEIKRLKVILGDHNASLRQTQSVWGKVKDTAAGTMLKLTALGGVIFGAVKTIQSFASSTEGIGDRVTHLTNATKEMFWELQRSVASLDFSNLINGLTEAWKRGKMLSEELDRLADVQAYSDYIVSSLSRESRRLEEITKNTFLEVSIRSEAARKREEIERKIYDRQVMMAEEAFKIEKKTWDDRNKIAAEEALRIYQTIEGLSKDVTEKLEKAFEYQSSLFGKKRAAEMIRSGQAMAGALKGIPKEIISSYADYFLLLEYGESDVMPKLFNAFKKYENDIEAAQTRMNSFVRESAMIFRQEANTIGKKGDTTGLETAVSAAIMSPEYFPSDYQQVITEMEAYLENEKRLNEERLKNNQETQAAIYESVADSAEESLQEIQRLHEEESKIIQEKVDRYSEFGTVIGDTMGKIMAGTEVTARELAKKLIELAFRELELMSSAYITKATMNNIATYGPLLGMIRSAGSAILIKGSLAAAKAVMLGGLSEGGYTSPGGKYEPRGIVHAGEWVANQDMVSSPLIGPVIKALEGYRQKTVPQYATGGYTLGPGASLNQPAGTGQDLFSKLLANIDLNNQLLSDLRSKGVKNFWPFSEINFMREGIRKIDDAESLTGI